MSQIPGKYRNNKNGKTYIATKVIPDCTNSRLGTSVVIYQEEGYPQEIAREVTEFFEKFTYIGD